MNFRFQALWHSGTFYPFGAVRLTFYCLNSLMASPFEKVTREKGFRNLVTQELFRSIIIWLSGYRFHELPQSLIFNR